MGRSCQSACAGVRARLDFDVLARRLAPHYRVVCPDIVGRGRSDWLTHAQSYVVPQYVADVLTLIARLNVNTVDWLGTSMGGLIGLGLAGALAASAAMQTTRGEHGLASVHRLSLGKVVLNDVGPALNGAGLARIGGYVSQAVTCTSFAQAVEVVRKTSASFGAHSQAQWEDLTRHVFVPQGEVWVKHYDLGIATPLQQQDMGALRDSEALLWAAYASLARPVLIVRGEHSDILSTQTAQDMLARNPHAELFEVAGVGHAPTLMHVDQVERVASFLLDEA